MDRHKVKSPLVSGKIPKGSENRGIGIRLWSLVHGRSPYAYVTPKACNISRIEA